MKNANKDVMLGKLADEYLVKVKAGEKISINDWVKKHKDVVPPDELKDQLRMGVLLTKVGERKMARPTLSPQDHQRIQANMFAYYDQRQRQAHDNYRLAQTLAGQEKYAEALPLIEKVLEVHPADPDIWLFKTNCQGMVYFNIENNPDKFLKTALSAAGRFPNDARFRILVAEGHRSRKESAQAFEQYQNAESLAAQPNLLSEIARRFLILGEDYLRVGDLPGAELPYHKALNLYLKHKHLQGITDCYHRLAYIYYRKGDYKQAIDALVSARLFIRQLPDNKEKLAWNEKTSDIIARELKDLANRLDGKTGSAVANKSALPRINRPGYRVITEGPVWPVEFLTLTDSPLSGRLFGRFQHPADEPEPQTDNSNNS